MEHLLHWNCFICTQVQLNIYCSAKQGIDPEKIRNYKSLFEYLTGDCSSEETTYVDWKYTPDKHSLSKEILDKWNLLKENVLAKHDGSPNVNMQCFEKLESVTKKKEMKLNNSMLFKNL